MCLALLPITFLALSSPLALGALPDPAALSSVLTSIPTARPGLALQSANTIMPSAGPILIQATTQPNALGLLQLFFPPPPIPAMLVKRLQVLQFVELKELLPGNISLSCQLDACLDSPLRSMGKLSPPFKDVSSILL